MAHVIRNFEALAETPLRRDALRIAEAGFGAVDPRQAIARKVSIEDNELIVGDTRRPLRGRRVFFVGIGKCAIVAAEAFEKLLGGRLTAGIALDVSPREAHALTRVEAIIGTHPLPSEENVRGSKRIVELLSGLSEDDLVITLVSGGGSTLICLPDAPMTCLDESALFTGLTGKGASIQELNTIRKHLSGLRGGGLARAAYPAEVLSLIISDVPGNDPEFISSGPTVRDDSTVEDAMAMLGRYGVTPPPRTAFIDTPKDRKYFERVENVLLLTNQDGLHAMRDEAEKLGYAAIIADDRFSGEASGIGRRLASELRDADGRSAFLYGGESTVTLGERSGKGGRCQEMALAAMESVPENGLILPFSSDGHDNTPFAGAIADSVTRKHAETHGIRADRFLAEHRSYDFFSTTEDALDTGYTGGNVSDFIITLKD